MFNWLFRGAVKTGLEDFTSTFSDSKKFQSPKSSLSAVARGFEVVM